MDPSLWFAFLAASTALLLVPGPTVLLVLAYALGEGRRVAVPTALGVATGDLLAMTLSVLGLGALVLASATLFTALKWIGALYLIWLGIGMIRGAGNQKITLDGAPRGLTRGRAFSDAATVTALNPKGIVFFIAFVPQFIDPARPFGPQAAILITTFVALAAVNALAYALAAARLRATIRRPGVLTWLSRAGGSVLIAMGIATATLRRGAA
ncbi:MAG: LysE family translocator [Pseudomonadota bacterium]